MPVAARVERYFVVRALLAARDMSIECRRAAALDCRHHIQLAADDMAGIGPPPRRAVAAGGFRDFRDGRDARHASGGRVGLRQRDASSGLMTSWIVLVATQV